MTQSRSCLCQSANNQLALVQRFQISRDVENFPVWIVEGHGVDDIGVLVKRQQFFAGHGVPDLASAIVTSSDELATVLVEGTVSERKQVSSEHLEEFKVLLLVLSLFLYEFLDQLFELGLA